MSLDIKADVLVHSSGEYLAKVDDYLADSLDHYLAISARFHEGEESLISDKLAKIIKIHALMSMDDEATVLNLHPEFAKVFSRSDKNQVIATAGTRNLAYFNEHGVDYSFDSAQAEASQRLVEPNVPLAVSLMRSNILASSGYENVRLNYIYHDVMDHIWIFNFMNNKGITANYSDYLESVGNPFNGSLMSREAELVSGIGFTSRRYLSAQEYYGKMALDPAQVKDYLAGQNVQADERVERAIKSIESQPLVAEWAGFVIKDTIANIIHQRGKRGSVKRLDTDDFGNFSSTGEVSPLFDPLYIAMIIDTVSQLSENRNDYIDAQVKLNLIIENILMRYLKYGSAVGQLSLEQAVEVSEISVPRREKLQDTGISTSYFRNTGDQAVSDPESAAPPA